MFCHKRHFDKIYSSVKRFSDFPLALGACVLSMSKKNRKALYCDGVFFAQVILGYADAYLHITKIKKWDLCAGHGILHALGGNLTYLDGEDIDYSPPVDVKLDVLVHKGFIGAVKNHAWFAAGTRKAREETQKK